MIVSFPVFCSLLQGVSMPRTGCDGFFVIGHRYGVKVFIAFFMSSCFIYGRRNKAMSQYSIKEIPLEMPFNEMKTSCENESFNQQGK